jgi:hypothetical protein
MVFAVFVVFLATISWTSPLSADAPDSSLAAAAQQATPTDNPEAGPTRTPFPPEYINNSRQSIGITFAAAVLVVIVIVGVLMFIPRNSEGM